MVHGNWEEDSVPEKNQCRQWENRKKSRERTMGFRRNYNMRHEANCANHLRTLISRYI